MLGMPPRPPNAGQTVLLARHGKLASEVRNYQAAKAFFTEAARLEPHNATRRVDLASALEALQDLSGAVAQLTEALHLDANNSDAARRLSSILLRHNLSSYEWLNPEGLKAALVHDAISRDNVADLAIRYLTHQGSLGRTLALGRTQGWQKAARELCLKKTDPALSDKLFLELLSSGVIGSPEIERLLTALRRTVVLELSPTRLRADGALVQFAIALMRQCWINEYVWDADAEELKVSRPNIDLPALLAGDPGQGAAFLRASLYGPIYKEFGSETDFDLETLRSIQPAPLGAALVERIAEWRDETMRARSMPRRGGFVGDTSRNIARQYESAPYPRWTRLGLPQRGEEFRAGIAQCFEPGRLAFTERPFEILVAGCGTGKSAIQLALGFGANAKVLAIDLSAASLAYAARLAQRYGASNIAFLQADIEEIGTFSDFRQRFSVIDCSGVLHHMKDTFSGWRSVLECLAPHGLMRVGLYSAIARAKLTALRADPLYPGAGCSDERLRQFRRILLDRGDGELGSELKASVDFYSTSGFRDLTLNVSERCHTLSEISQFLADTGLRFRGFFPPYLFQFLRQRHPWEPWPGSLKRWARLERTLPTLFMQMYVFWCDRQ
jgi:SAM-dependent methyltransferase